MSFKKDGVLVFQQLMFNYSQKDAGAMLQGIQFLGPWLMDQPHEAKGEGIYFQLITEIEKLLFRFQSGAPLLLHDFAPIIPALETLSLEWISDLNINLYLDYGHPRADKLPIRRDVQYISVREDAANIKDTDGQTINILFSDGMSALSSDETKVDICLVAEDLESATAYCLAFPLLDYDRSYLRGKLESISGANNKAQVLLTGSSQAAAGLLEDAMSRPSINLSVGAQDPYYASEIITAAKKKSKALNTAVIAAPYHFWYTNINSEKPEYLRSVLQVVYEPLLGRVGSRSTGEHPPYTTLHSMPLLESVFDIQFIMESHSKNLSTLAADLSYYSDRYNPRPVTGNLTYRFTQLSDEENREPALKMTQLYEEHIDHEEFERNLSIFGEFLDRMRLRGVTVYIVIPPASATLRKASRGTNGELAAALDALGRDNLIFKDYYDNPEFSDGDFQDYDHLTERGAQKFTKMISDLIS